jgi:hypothetical protein
MKFKQFAEEVIKLYKDKETHNMDVIYSCDDEGNSFHHAFNTPSVEDSKDFEIYTYKGKTTKKIIIIN